MLRLQLPLGERYTDATLGELAQRIAAAKATLGDRVFILGHHYQRDEVMEWADARGDSFRLSVLAQEQPQADYIIFCGVHFMAESADILTGDHQAVILPDLNAGCSMADMADLEEVTEAWETLAATTDISKVIPITYMNSSAALKAFVGEHGGAVCTSSNARAVLEWALSLGNRAEDGAGGEQVLFFPINTSAATLRWALVSPTSKCVSGIPDANTAASPKPKSRTPPSFYGRATAPFISGSAPNTLRHSAKPTPTALW